MPFRAEGAAGGTTAAARSDEVCREDCRAIVDMMRTYRAIGAKTSGAAASADATDTEALSKGCCMGARKGTWGSKRQACRLRPKEVTSRLAALRAPRPWGAADCDRRQSHKAARQLGVRRVTRIPQLSEGARPPRPCAQTREQPFNASVDVGVTVNRHDLSDVMATPKVPFRAEGATPSIGGGAL